jgi:hypothetical protein
MVLTKHELLIYTLTNFYSIQTDDENKINYDKLLNILNTSNDISLRIIDWFITNYSKKYNIILSNNNNNRFVVFLDYKSQLKAYSKKYFDPFCRRERIEFNIFDKEQIITTVGQLNFFKWIIQNNIIKYITENLADIELDMHNSLKKAYSKKNTTRKKRRELSICANKCMTKENIQIILTF